MKKRLLSILLCLGVLLSIFAVGAAAADHGYDLSVSKNGRTYAAGNPKSDNEQRAYVYVTENNIITSDRVYISVWDSTSSLTGLNCTGNYRIYGNSRNILDYTIPTVQNQTMYLQFTSLENTVRVKGHWFP